MSIKIKKTIDKHSAKVLYMPCKAIMPINLKNAKSVKGWFKMATFKMAFQNGTIIATGIESVTLENVYNEIGTIFANGFTSIDAKLAYAQAMAGKIEIEAKNLCTLCKVIMTACENTGKNAGISTVYNVLDCRMVRGFNFKKYRKLAYNLQGSKSLAAFVAITMPVIRNEQTKTCTSVNGNIFEQNRNGYNTKQVNTKGKMQKVSKPQKAHIVIHGNDNAKNVPNKIRQFFDWCNANNVPVVIEQPKKPKNNAMVYNYDIIAL